MTRPIDVEEVTRVLGQSKELRFVQITTLGFQKEYGDNVLYGLTGDGVVYLLTTRDKTWQRCNMLVSE